MSKFDSYARQTTARETDKGKFASAKASPDSVSQGVKRKIDNTYKATKK